MSLNACLAMLTKEYQINLKAMITQMKTPVVRKGKLKFNLCHYRLLQNRQSAMKCRIKKKAEFEELKIKLQDLKNVNVELGL